MAAPATLQLTAGGDSVTDEAAPAFVGDTNGGDPPLSVTAVSSLGQKLAYRRLAAIAVGLTVMLGACAAVLAVGFGVNSGAPVLPPHGTRAVVFISGGGWPHPFMTPWDTCDGGLPAVAAGLLAHGLPTFMAPGYTSDANSTAKDTGCPPPLNVSLEFDTQANADKAGAQVAGFLGYLRQTYGFVSFDLVGFSYGGLVGRSAIASVRAAQSPHSQASLLRGMRIASLTTLVTPHLGSYAYDLQNNATTDVAVKALVGPQGLALAHTLDYAMMTDNGSIDSVVTAATRGPDNWNLRRIGDLDGMPVTLIGGDALGGGPYILNDGTVPLSSQLMQDDPNPVPAGVLPPGVVRRVFPVYHSPFIAQFLGLPANTSALENPAVSSFVAATVAGHWDAAGTRRPLPILHA